MNNNPIENNKIEKDISPNFKTKFKSHDFGATFTEKIPGNFNILSSGSTQETK